MSISRKYLAHVDGLRAIAVVSVVLFHAGVTSLGGGFVGVDVFFVISGFLITSHLMAELQENGRVDIVKFYDRRIRRIFPALFTVIFFTLVVGLIMMTPTELSNLSESIIATSLFYSNLHLMRESGYFSTASTYQPMLHTWSLAVEEQFYIFWPLILYFLHRYLRNGMFIIAILGTILSFFVSVIFLTSHPTATFYMLPTRAWELTVGALLAITPHRPALRFQPVLAWTGLLAIVLPVFLYSENIPFPGIAAVPPVLGAVLIIACGGVGSISRLLGSPPFRAIGLISYSLYLWHWPVLTFAHLAFGQVLPMAVSAICVLASVIAATVSWRFVERPFRKPYNLTDRPWRVLALGGAAMGISCLAGLATLGGVPSRLPDDVVAIARIGETPLPRNYPCFSDASVSAQGTPDVRNCLKGGSKPKMIVWGDSHLLPFAAPLIEHFGSQYDVRIVGRTGCMPLASFTARRGGQVDPACTKLNRDLLRELATARDVSHVLIIGRWARTFFSDDSNEKQELIDSSGRIVSPAMALPSSFRTIVDTLSKSGAKLVVFGDVPEMKVDAPECLAQTKWRNMPSSFCKFLAETLPGSQSDRLIKSLKGRLTGVRFLEPTAYLCPNHDCKYWIHGKPILHDTDHLTLDAGDYILTRSGLIHDLHGV